MLHLDGSYGEGDGQIMRRVLSLSVVLGILVRIDHIWVGRPNPGLRPQHLTVAQALAQIS